MSVAGDVDEVIVSDETAAVLRELALLDPDCERLVFGMRAHPDGAVLLAGADDLEELIGFVASPGNRRTQPAPPAAPPRRRVQCTDRVRPNPLRLNILGPAVSVLGLPKHLERVNGNPPLLSLTPSAAAAGGPVAESSARTPTAKSRTGLRFYTNFRT